MGSPMPTSPRSPRSPGPHSPHLAHSPQASEASFHSHGHGIPRDVSNLPDDPRQYNKPREDLVLMQIWNNLAWLRLRRKERTGRESAISPLPQSAQPVQCPL